MAEVKIARALARYRVEDKRGRTATRMAFYGQVVDIPDDEERDRLLENGDAVEPDVSLDRPGEMMPLPNTASDAEIRAWVAVANQSDIDKVKEERPDIADRLEDALAYVGKNDGNTGSAPNPGENEGDGAASPASEQEYNPDENEYDDLVGGNVSVISDYLRENPEDAQEILAAENRRAKSEDDEPRKGVLTAVEIAVGQPSA